MVLVYFVGLLNSLFLHFPSPWWQSLFSIHPLFLVDLLFSISSTFLGDGHLFFYLSTFLVGPLSFSIPPTFCWWISFFFLNTSLFLVIFFLCAISSICEVEKGKICVVVTEKSYFLFSVTVFQPRHYGISVIRIFHDCDYNRCVLWAVCELVLYAAASH